jgi:hypothetical protein
MREIIMLAATKEDLSIMASRLFEETLKLKLSENEKDKDKEIHEIKLMIVKKKSQIDLLKISRFSSNLSKFF